VVRQRSAKPLSPSSNLGGASKQKASFTGFPVNKAFYFYVVFIELGTIWVLRENKTIRW
jgi:hypothetical protein